ncbi:hypothetical protein Pcaca04_38680 [Pectobacterium carotovorum subsp. carotovorum]|nr:hypothetical protein Pcaca04_38680 [Pectobacterium carotovorum subsp. carotovorum]
MTLARLAMACNVVPNDPAGIENVIVGAVVAAAVSAANAELATPALNINTPDSARCTARATVKTGFCPEHPPL